MPANPYTAQFNRVITNMQDHRASTGSTAPVASSTLGSLLNSERFNQPLATAVSDAQDTGFWAGLGHAGSALLDLISRPLYAVGSVTEQGFSDINTLLKDKAGALTPDEKIAFENRNPLTATGDVFNAIGQGLSGKNKVTPGQVIDKNAPWATNAIGEGLAGAVLPGRALATQADGSNSLNKFLGTFAFDAALDPINLIGTGAITGAARATKALATGKGIKGAVAAAKLDVKAAKDAATLAVQTERAVPKVVVSEIKNAKTPAELATATNKAKAAVNTDEITAKLAELHKLDPAVTPSVVPAIPEHQVGEIISGLKSAHANVLVDGGYGNKAQANLLTSFTKDAMEKAKIAGANAGAPLQGTSKVDFLTSDIMPKLKAAEDTADATGIPHYVSSGSGQRKWPIKTSDWVELLPKNIVKLHVFGSLKVAPEAINAGVAKALDLQGQGLKDAEAIKEIAASMKNGGKSGSASTTWNMAKAIYSKSADFVERVAVNRAKAGLKHTQDVTPLISSEVNYLHGALTTGGHSEVATALSGATKRIAQAGAAAGATPATILTAQTHVAEAIANMVDKADFVLTLSNKHVVAAIKAGVPEKLIREKVAAQVKIQTNLMLEEARKAAQLSREETYEIGLVASMKSLTRLKVSSKEGVKAAVDMNRAVGAVGLAGRDIGDFNHTLNVIRKYKTADVQAAMSDIKLGGSAADVPELKQVVDQLFDPADSVSGSLWRNGGNVDQVNGVLKQAGISNKFDLTLAGGDVAKMADQWKDWKIEDPVSFLHQAYDALRKLSSYQTAAITMENNFGSKVYKAGWVKIIPAEDSRIATHLTPGMYFPKHVAEQIDYLEYSAGAKRSFAGSKSLGGQVIDKWYDPMLSIWKTYATIIRPGHWFRNFMGDGFFNHAAGMNNFPLHYGEAFGILKDGKGSVLSKRITVGGQTHSVSGDGILRAFRENGLQPNYHVVEDIIDQENKGKINRFLTENKAVKFGGHVSEKLNDEGKLAQFLWEIKRPENLKNAKDLPHLYAIAARNVRKWHPDASGLAPFEARVVRRLVPFYSWIRQAVPLVMEATVTRPGRIMLLPKANYDLAIASGVDPNSVSDQWPTDGTAYPSYFTTNILGPNNFMGDGNGVYLGSPVESVYGDVLNSTSNNPLSLADMLSPFIKAPVELATGTRLSDPKHKPILDKGEYIDQQLPLINNFSSISGYSPTGTLTNLIGAGPAGAPLIDPLRSVLRGDKQHVFNQSLVNFFTGLGIKDYNNASDQRNAMREARNANP